MSSKIPIPKSTKLTGFGTEPYAVAVSGGERTKHLNSATYCYIKADEDHHDLEDIFGGKYIKAQEIWRFPKNKEQQVYNFLDCSSSESEKCESDSEKWNRITTVYEDESVRAETDEAQNELILAEGCGRQRRDRLHRANSFNASDESNDECDSLDEHFRRHRALLKSFEERNELKKEADKY